MPPHPSLSPPVRDDRAA